jgi:hypothetical protein
VLLLFLGRPLAARHSYVLACAWQEPTALCACPKNVTRQGLQVSTTRRNPLPPREENVSGGRISRGSATKPVKLLTVAHLRESLTTTPRLVSRLCVLAAMASAVVVRPLPSAQPAQPHSLQCTVVRVVVSRTSRRPARRLNGCVCECLCEGVRACKERVTQSVQTDRNR